jgi:hypothetical protein
MSKDIILGKGRKVILEEMMDKNSDYLEELRIKEKFFARKTLAEKKFELELGKTQREIKEVIGILDFIKEIYKEEYE